MQQKAITFIATLLLSLATITAYAGMDMGGTDMKSGHQIMLPTTVVDGVSAMAHLLDIKETMVKRGMAATNHFMIMFTDQKSNKDIPEGIVALKITHPNGHTDKPIKLMTMSNAFGSDITLADRGTYLFTVGTKLSDHNKRIFHFQYTVK